MALTQTQPRCRHRLTQVANATIHPLKKAPTKLVSEARVKEMLRDIAFVLQVTRRLNQEITEPKNGTSAVQN
jgi:hypothetical protein